MIQTPKVLFLDLETAPIEVRVWQIYEPRIGLNQITKDWCILSWSAKWLGDSDYEIMCMSQRNKPNLRDDKAILRALWQLIDACDIIVTHNGKKFDKRKFNTRFLINEMGPPSSYRHIDTISIARKHFGFTSNSLEYIAETLGVKYKKLKSRKFQGMDMWNACLDRNQDAWDEMEKYNKRDVLVLEGIYKKIIPWDNSLNFSVYSDSAVCTCGNSHFQKNGFYYTNSGKYQRYKCSSCASEVRDKQNLLVNKEIKVGTVR